MGAPSIYDPETHIVRSKQADALLQREANINNRPLVRHLLGVVKYLGLGALVHAWFLGTVFDTRDLWSWGYLLAWPVPLFFWLAFWGLAVSGYAVAAIIICAGLWWGCVAVLEARERRSRDYRRKVVESELTGRKSDPA